MVASYVERMMREGMTEFQAVQQMLIISTIRDFPHSPREHAIYLTLCEEEAHVENAARAKQAATAAQPAA